MDSNPKPEKVRVAEAAKEIGVSTSTLRLKIKRREIGVQKLGYRTQFVYRAEIEAFLARKTQRRLAI